MAGTTSRRTTGAQTRVTAAEKAAAPAVKKAAAARKAATPAKKAVAKKAATPAKKAVAPVANKAASPAAKKAGTPAKKAVAKKAPSTRAAAVKATPKRSATPRPAGALASVSEKDVRVLASELAPVPVVPTAPGPMRRRFLVGAGLALVLVLVGSVAAFALRDPAPSKASFIAKADQICRPGNGPVTAIVRPTSYPELSTASDTVATTTGAELEQLDHLRLPSGDNGTQAKAAIKALSTYSGAAKTLKGAAEKKDAPATIAATKSLKAAFADAKKKSKAFGFSACGAGMEPGIDTTLAGASAVIKTEFTAKADSLCRAAATKFENMPEPDTDAGLIATLNEALAVTQKLVADLRTIPAPPGDEAVVTEMLDAADKINSKTAELRDAVVANDFARADAIIKEGGPISTESNHQFDAYGLGICGSNFGA